MTTPANPPADLVAFIRAQLDEDEQVAHEALDLPPMVGEWRWARVSANSTRLVPCGRHHPARVLQDVDAKRRILDECDYWFGKVEAGESYPALADRFEVAMSVLRLLALPFAGRPGFREEWKPT